MNENLCKVLEGCEGTELYSPMFGQVTLLKITEDSIMIDSGFNYSHYHYFTKEGYYVVYANAINAECLIFPSKDQRDWNKFVRPILKGTPMMCSDDAELWILKRYYGYIDYAHYVFSLKDTGERCRYVYIVPYDKFDPNNIEKSLEYNIQK